MLRSAPGTGADSAILPGRLWPGTRFAILEGPVEASDYRWYRVQVGELTGWAAAGSNEGVPWMAAVRNGAISFGGQPAADPLPQVFLIDPGGSDLRQLTHLTDADIALAVALADDDPGALRPVLTCGFGLGGSWSPSGERFAFNVGSCDTVILTVAADGSDLVHIADGRGMAWSNDGARLAYGLNIPYLVCGRACGGVELGPWDIQAAPATGGPVASVSHGAAWEVAYGPIWSPSGGELAFTCGPIDGASSVCMVNSDGTDQRIVAAGSLLSLSPDGSRLVIRRTDAAGVSELWVARADGSDEIILPGVGEAFPAAWSPDGQLIAMTVFGVAGAGPTTILISPDGSASRELAAGSRFEAWAPDGRSVLVSGISASEATTLYLVDVASGVIAPIVDLPSELIGGSSGFAWQPLVEYSLH